MNICFLFLWRTIAKFGNFKHIGMLRLACILLVTLWFFCCRSCMHLMRKSWTCCLLPSSVQLMQCILLWWKSEKLHVTEALMKDCSFQDIWWPICHQSQISTKAYITESCLFWEGQQSRFLQLLCSSAYTFCSCRQSHTPLQEVWRDYRCCHHERSLHRSSTWVWLCDICGCICVWACCARQACHKWKNGKWWWIILCAWPVPACWACRVYVLS